MRGFYLIRLTGRGKNQLINSTINFMFLPLIQRQTPQKQWCCDSPAPPACCTFPPYYPPSRLPVFGWLLRLKSLIDGHLRPQCILYYIFFVGQFATPNDGTLSPHALPTQRTSALTPPLLLPPTIGLIVV